MMLRLQNLFATSLIVVSFWSTNSMSHSDSFEKAYQRGLAEGFKLAKEKCGEDNSAYDYNSVEVCGGGVNLNGKYYPGGKTGCVSVDSSGNVRQY